MEEVMCGKTENQLDAKHTTSEQAWAKAAALENLWDLQLGCRLQGERSSPDIRCLAVGFFLRSVSRCVSLMRLLPFGTSHVAVTNVV